VRGREECQRGNERKAADVSYARGGLHDGKREWKKKKVTWEKIDDGHGSKCTERNLTGGHREAEPRR